MKRAWVLNLEADDERARGRGWTPPRALLANVDERARSLIGTLVTGDDVVIERGDQRTFGSDFTGEAWSPTERALAAMKRAGVRAPEVPSREVLDFVCSREFSQGLLACEPREQMVTESNRSAVALPEGATRVSLAYTCAGRGHFVAENAAQREVIIERALAKSARVFVAERVCVLDDFALHGMITRSGATLLGDPTGQRVDPRTNAWRESHTGPALSERERDALYEHANNAAEALVRAGYWGPFGIDAFRYRDGDGAERFCPRCEVNARYTMGWAIGMARVREAATSRVEKDLFDHPSHLGHR